MRSPKPLLEVQELSKSYGRFQALSSLSFQMNEGEIISVLGPSGCGKSTLLQLVAGLSQPDGGQIVLNGECIASARKSLPPEKRGINMVFQDYALWPHMTVFDNIAYGLKNTKLSKSEKEGRVGELLDMLHLKGLEKRLPPQLSGGQQQRVSIARALATRPRLMLLDEPLSNLDMRLRIEMRTEMAYLFRKLGISVFHVTHDPDEAFAMADRLLIMRNGRLDQIGTPEHCYHRPASRWAASLLGAINRLQGTIVRTSSGYGLRVGNTIWEGAPFLSLQGAEGKAGELLFRPEDLVLSAENVTANDTGLLPMTVKHCTFEGKKWRSVMEVEGQAALFLTTDLPLEANSRICASLPKEHAYLYLIEEEL